MNAANAPAPMASSPESGSSPAGDILRHLLDAIRESLAPPQLDGLLRQVGMRLAHQALAHMRRTRRVARPLTVKDYVHCIESVHALWAWPCSVVELAEDRVTISVPPAPLGAHRHQGGDMGRDMTLLEAGLFGGIAAEAFGYGKIAAPARKGPPGGPRRLIVYTRPSAESRAVQGWTFPEEAGDIAPPLTPAENEDVLERVSPREHQVLRLVGEGLSNKDIARELGISPRTVEGHVSRICVKLDLRRRADLIRFAFRHKLVTL